MALTEEFIRKCTEDEALYRALADELERRIAPELSWDKDGHVERMRACPVGLRAMAAVHPLDVEMALGDLGSYFINWLHRPHCEETLAGLRELEIAEAAEIFGQAYAVALPHWATLEYLRKGDANEFGDWYGGSDLEKALEPLNDRMWEFCDRTKSGLLSYWVPYARKYPERVVSDGPVRHS
jgi:hypothetical protein